MKRSIFLLISMILNIMCFILIIIEDFVLNPFLLTSIRVFISLPVMMFLATVGLNFIAFYLSNKQIKQIDLAITFTSISTFILVLRALFAIAPFSFASSFHDIPFRDFPWYMQSFLIATLLQPVLNFIAISDIKIKQKSLAKNMEDDVL